ncbi:hypothetical protein [Apilactobacillus quenuiae]|uniref:hypothetical protein n=1 Tax=Apilactobacillus quenuiae TaxID=2008377 RepID=UPI000D01B37B|nr:hypothetical protein [Apilactobacillus quenuiae]
MKFHDHNNINNSTLNDNSVHNVTKNYLYTGVPSNGGNGNGGNGKKPWTAKLADTILEVLDKMFNFNDTSDIFEGLLLGLFFLAFLLILPGIIWWFAVLSCLVSILYYFVMRYFKKMAINIHLYLNQLFYLLILILLRFNTSHFAKMFFYKTNIFKHINYNSKHLFEKSLIKNFCNNMSDNISNLLHIFKSFNNFGFVLYGIISLTLIVVCLIQSLRITAERTNFSKKCIRFYITYVVIIFIIIFNNGLLSKLFSLINKN